MNSHGPSTLGGSHDTTSPPEDTRLTDPAAAEARRLLDQYLALEASPGWRSSVPIRQKYEAILAAPEEVQIAVARVVFDTVVKGGVEGSNRDEIMRRTWTYLPVWCFLIQRPLPFDDGDLAPMMEVALRCWEELETLPDPLRYVAGDLKAGTLAAVERFAAGHGLTDGLRAQLLRLRRLILAYRGPFMHPLRDAWDVDRIGRMLRGAHAAPYETGEPWADAALGDLAEMDAAGRSAWQALLVHAASAKPSKPPAKWLKQAEALVSAVGEEAVARYATHWLNEKSRQSAQPLAHRNTDLVKGLVWCCSLLEDKTLCRALANLGEAGAPLAPDRRRAGDGAAVAALVGGA